MTLKIATFSLTYVYLVIIAFYLKVQVEQNVDFVQRKRGEVAFSPKDQQSVESFLQVLGLSVHWQTSFSHKVYLSV